jgi:hypothetical protein
MSQAKVVRFGDALYHTECLDSAELETATDVVETDLDGDDMCEACDMYFSEDEEDDE